MTVSPAPRCEPHAERHPSLDTSMAPVVAAHYSNDQKVSMPKIDAMLSLSAQPTHAPAVAASASTGIGTSLSRRVSKFLRVPSSKALHLALSASYLALASCTRGSKAVQ